MFTTVLRSRFTPCNHLMNDISAYQSSKKTLLAPSMLSEEIVRQMSMRSVLLFWSTCVRLVFSFYIPLSKNIDLLLNQPCGRLVPTNLQKPWNEPFFIPKFEHSRLIPEILLWYVLRHIFHFLYNKRIVYLYSYIIFCNMRIWIFYEETGLQSSLRKLSWIFVYFYSTNYLKFSHGLSFN